MSERRRLLLLIGIVPSALALIFSTLVLLMLHSQREGQEKFSAGDFDRAAAAFGEAGALNPFQDWIAAFDRGAAAHAGGDYDAAIDRYETALPAVPTRHACTVRINLALAHEAVGDAAAADDDATDARAAWTAGIKVLREGRCPTDSGRGEKQTEQAAAVEKRLQEKLSSEPEKKDKDSKKDKEQQKREQKKEKQEKERKLQKQNEQGQKRRERQEQERKESGGYQPRW